MQLLKLKHTFNLLDFLFIKNFLKNKNFFIIEYGKNKLTKKNSIFLKKTKNFSFFNSFYFKSSSVFLLFFAELNDLLQYNTKFLLYIKIKNLYFINIINFLFFKKFFKIFNLFFYYLTTNFKFLRILSQIINKK